MRILRELVLELLGELGFRALSIVWFLVWTIGLIVLCLSLDVHPRWGMWIGGAIGVIGPLLWWIKRQVDEQKRLAD